MPTKNRLCYLFFKTANKEESHNSHKGRSFRVTSTLSVADLSKLVIKLTPRERAERVNSESLQILIEYCAKDETDPTSAEYTGYRMRNGVLHKGKTPVSTLKQDTKPKHTSSVEKIDKLMNIINTRFEDKNIIVVLNALHLCHKLILNDLTRNFSTYIDGKFNIPQRFKDATDDDVEFTTNYAKFLRYRVEMKNIIGKQVEDIRRETDITLNQTINVHLLITEFSKLLSYISRCMVRDKGTNAAKNIDPKDAAVFDSLSTLCFDSKIIIRGLQLAVKVVLNSFFTDTLDDVMKTVGSFSTYVAAVDLMNELLRYMNKFSIKFSLIDDDCALQITRILYDHYSALSQGIPSKYDDLASRPMLGPNSVLLPNQSAHDRIEHNANNKANTLTNNTLSGSQTSLTNVKATQPNANTENTQTNTNQPNTLNHTQADELKEKASLSSEIDDAFSVFDQLKEKQTVSKEPTESVVPFHDSVEEIISTLEKHAIAEPDMSKVNPVWLNANPNQTVGSVINKAASNAFLMEKSALSIGNRQSLMIHSDNSRTFRSPLIQKKEEEKEEKEEKGEEKEPKPIDFVVRDLDRILSDINNCLENQ